MCNKLLRRLEQSPENGETGIYVEQVATSYINYSWWKR
jgi:hypothetical protein